jgi:hypothetical protein
VFVSRSKRVARLETLTLDIACANAVIRSRAMPAFADPNTTLPYRGETINSPVLLSTVSQSATVSPEEL